MKPSPGASISPVRSCLRTAYSICSTSVTSACSRRRVPRGALVVGVNGDASVRRLGKGGDRPIVPAVQRARLLAALACVDCVVQFDADTPLELIQRLRPDVLVKGADYARQEIVGADEVEGWGGRVVRVALVPGYSTTELVARLRRGAG